jgi:hypothetical protein
MRDARQNRAKHTRAMGALFKKDKREEVVNPAEMFGNLEVEDKMSHPRGDF